MRALPLTLQLLPALPDAPRRLRRKNHERAMTDDKPKSNKVVFFLTRSQIDGLRYYLDSDKKTKPPEPGWAMRANLTTRGRYARLNQDEQNLITWYLDLRRDAISELWYDVRTDGRPEHIQHQLPVDITDDPTMLRMWWHQNAKRIDAIAL